MNEEKWKKEHAKYLKQPFELKPLKHLDYDFSDDELSLLHKYGAWFTALMDGKLTPRTTKQEDFVKVCEGVKEPSDPLEYLWKRYIDILALEKRKELSRIEEGFEASKHEREAEKQRRRDARREILRQYRVGEKGHTTSTSVSDMRDSKYPEVCRRCGGDGGATGNCEACGGTGWIFPK
jgi:uncharacterized protein YifE (UPF0438 family)